MKSILDSFRDPERVAYYLSEIRQALGQSWTLMEVCGGQTHAIMHSGLSELLPDEVNLVHGPGCPVCVTPIAVIDQAHEIARQSDVVLCSFGDMLRVPGNHTDLLTLRADGCDIRALYSPLDAVELAASIPDKEVVFFAVGFETTAPATALALSVARQREIKNFSMLVSHVLVPPAMEAILGDPENQVQGFLAAGHVCTIMGTAEYEPLAEQFGVPIVIAGFEPVDLLKSILMCIRQLEAGQSSVEIQYTRAVNSRGNRMAQELIRSVFEVSDQSWRGLGLIPSSGYQLRPQYHSFDANRRFGSVTSTAAREKSLCLGGQILTGRITPKECPEFGVTCTPEFPLGAPMVSDEGACSAYFRYQLSD